MAPIDTGRVDAGVIRGLKLVLIGVALLPVYKVLSWLYPAQEILNGGSSSGELFEKGSIAVLLLLFGAGALRIAYALTVERRKATQSANS